MFQQINEGIVIKIKVIPKASRTEFVGWEGDELKIRLKAVPEKGLANDELIRFLATFFQISKSNVVLLKGAASRHKKLIISGLELKKAEEYVKQVVQISKNNLSR
jgi:hypothetical protein